MRSEQSPLGAGLLRDIGILLPLGVTDQVLVNPLGVNEGDSGNLQR